VHDAVQDVAQEREADSRVYAVAAGDFDANVPSVAARSAWSARPTVATSASVLAIRTGRPPPAVAPRHAGTTLCAVVLEPEALDVCDLHKCTALLRTSCCREAEQLFVRTIDGNVQLRPLVAVASIAGIDKQLAIHAVEAHRQCVLVDRDACDAHQQLELAAAARELKRICDRHVRSKLELVVVDARERWPRLTCSAAKHGVGSSELASAHSVTGRDTP
jgi:hypothetical protein